MSNRAVVDALAELKARAKRAADEWQALARTLPTVSGAQPWPGR